MGWWNRRMHRESAKAIWVSQSTLLYTHVCTDDVFKIETNRLHGRGRCRGLSESLVSTLLYCKRLMGSTYGMKKKTVYLKMIISYTKLKLPLTLRKCDFDLDQLWRKVFKFYVIFFVNIGLVFGWPTRHLILSRVAVSKISNVIYFRIKQLWAFFSFFLITPIVYHILRTSTIITTYFQFVNFF